MSFTKTVKMCFYDRFTNENPNREGNNLFLRRNSNRFAEPKQIY